MEGADYAVAPETPTLRAGQSAVTVTLTAVDDSGEEPDETVVIAPSHGGARIGTQTVTIAASHAPAACRTSSSTRLALLSGDLERRYFQPRPEVWNESA